MNKTELIETISASIDVPKSTAENTVNAFVEAITQTLSNGDTVSLPGFGSFSTSVRAARTGRNPQTGEPLEIAEATIPKFKAGKALKDRVNK